MRPTGKLHLGNYMGALHNWVQLQHEYECFFFIADYHALTTDYANTKELKSNIRAVALDFLAGGLDPNLCTIFRQSKVPAHFELNDLLAMITPVSWLERVPTYKDQIEQLKEKDLATFGFLGYPLLQTADILVYQPSFVPVGQDQAAHVEITREIARRFNFLYPGNGAFKVLPPIEIEKYEQLRKLHSEKMLNELVKPGDSLFTRTLDNPADFAAFSATVGKAVLPEPQVLLTPSPKLPGTDGRKMSKSYGNTILLSDPEPEIRAKFKTMVTDPARIRRTDPGNPDVCPVFDLHKVFSAPETQQTAAEGCRSAGIGCIQCKGWLADAVVTQLAPIQERRRYFESRPDEVEDIFKAGNARANERANQTMVEVRTAMGID